MRSLCVVVSTWSLVVFTAAGACSVLVCFAGQPPNLRSLHIRTYLVRQVSLGYRPGDDASGAPAEVIDASHIPALRPRLVPLIQNKQVLAFL